MQLEQYEIKIKDVVFTVCELPFSEVQIILDGENTNLGIELVKKSVQVGGKPIGDAISGYGTRTVRLLIKEATDVNGFNDDEGKS